MVAPLPALAPVIPPDMEPMVQAKELGAEAFNDIPGPVPLHIVAVLVVVTAGIGFTVTVMVYGSPSQFPVVAVGVTIYSTVPGVELLGLVSVWSMVAPFPALAPVIPPDMVPMVQA